MRQILMGAGLAAVCLGTAGLGYGGGRRHRAARHGLVPCWRPGRRGQRQRGAHDRAPARRAADQARSERPVHGRADVRAIFPAEEQEGQGAALDVARRRIDWRHLRKHAGWPRRLGELLHPQGLGHLRVRRGRARPLGLCVARRVAVGADLPHLSGSVRALPHRRWRRLVERRSGQAEGDAGQPVPGRGLRQLHEAVGAALALHRQCDHRRVSRIRRQGLPLRPAAAQPGRRVRFQGCRAAARQDQGHRRNRSRQRRGLSPMRRS